MNLVTSLLITLAMALPETAADTAARRKALNDLLAEQWDYTLARNPELASVLGDKRGNDRLNDLSQAAVAEDLAQARDFLRRFEEIDTAGFPEQEVLNKSLMVRDLRQGLEDARFRGWLMPVTQVGGPHLNLPEIVSVLTFGTAKDYRDYIARLRQVPKAL
ncbi:MAG: DUF885 family protein, partial [Vicinamibacteria bacterium]